MTGPTDTRQPFRVYLLDENGRRHQFDSGPIYANDPEEAWRIAIGGSLGLSMEESLEMDQEELSRRFDERARQDGEPGVEAVFVETWG